MVSRSHTKWISPRKWFPADDPIACAVARLCVLREDLYIEFLAMSMNDVTYTLGDVFTTEDGKLPHIDDNGEEYRRIYFFRASLHTLAEVHNAVSGLRNNKDFRRMYRNFGLKFYNHFLAYLSSLDKNLTELRRIRNALGGHVSRDGVRKALETMDFDETGKLDAGQKVKDTHYGFAGTI